MTASALYQANWPDSFPDSQSIGAYREQLVAYNDWAAEQFMTADIQALVLDRALFFDQLITHLWQQFNLPDQDLAVLAIGGFGRGILHPGSDIDLLFIYAGDTADKLQPGSLQPDSLQPEYAKGIANLTTFLWDMRVDVGHSVRTLEQCHADAATDITFATSLIEHRLLSGDQQLGNQLQQMVVHDFPWSSRAFYNAKVAEQQERHAHFHGTAYNLEPNVKSSPGGLRDIQTINWIAKQHFKTKTDESLVEYGYISASERLELREYANLLWRIRYALHLESGKCEDRLLFDFQPGVAARLGYGAEGKPAVEAMMKDYFTAVLGVNELNRMLLQFFEQAILGNREFTDAEHIDADFTVVNQQIVARHDDVFADAVTIMRFFFAIADHPQVESIEAHTLRLLRNAREELRQPLSDLPECREAFMALIRHPEGCGKAFELLHRTQIMANYIPQWQHIVGQMQFDLFHAYTVDEHTFRLVRNLCRYTQAEFLDEFPLCTEIVQRMKQPELLYLAGIFHDIAKGRGGDHSELGEVDARNFGIQHGLADAEIELVAWLVRHHLVMSVTAQKRDIHDPEIIEQFARTVGSLKQLDYLYCLTVADIRATNKSLWNSWKASLLEELYHATARHLKQSEDNAAVTTRKRISHNKSHAMGWLLSAGFEIQEVNSLWGRFTADYFLRHRPEQIAWHSQHIIQLTDDHALPMVLVSNENHQGTTELFVYHHEQNHLFAAVVAVLDSQRLTIHDAQILATRDGYVMDTFMVLQHDGEPLTHPERIEELQQQLYDVMHQRQSVPSNNRRLPRRLRNFSVPTKVEFLTQKNKRRTLFELTALDQPGLVAKVARVLQEMQLNVLAAKITTIGEQAEDLFIVSNAQQQALNDDEKNALRAKIIDVLEC